MKDRKEVIDEFNGFVNMDVSELESWLKSPESKGAGWTNSDAQAGSETVGHNSGGKIVEILKSNPDQEPDKYTDEQIAHMRKVVSYCKRHLAQETAGNNEKSADELEKTKSYKSLKNWGHDFLKAQGQTETSSKQKKSPNTRSGKKKSSQKADEKEDENDDGEEEQAEDGKDDDQIEEMEEETKETPEEVEEEAEEDDEEYEEDEDEEEAEEEQADEAEDDAEGGSTKNASKKHTGQKRKSAAKQNGTTKKRQTRKGASSKKKTDDTNGDKDEDDEAEEVAETVQEADQTEDEAKEDEEVDGKGNGDEDGRKSSNGISKGDTVTWKWGSGHPQGKVLDVKEETTTIQTKRGNEVSRKGKPGDPAVVLDAGKSKAIKLAHELD